MNSDGSMRTNDKIKIQKLLENPIELLQTSITKLPGNENEKGSLKKLDLAFRMFLDGPLKPFLHESQLQNLDAMYSTLKLYLTPCDTNKNLNETSKNLVFRMRPEVLKEFDQLSDDHKQLFRQYYEEFFDLAMERHKKKGLNPTIDNLESYIAATMAFHCIKDPELKPQDYESFLEFHKVIFENLNKMEEKLANECEARRVNESLSKQCQEQCHENYPKTSLSNEAIAKVDNILNSVNNLVKKVKFFESKFQDEQKKLEDLQCGGRSNTSFSYNKAKLNVEDAEFNYHQSLREINDKLHTAEMVLKRLMSQNEINETANNLANEEIQKIYSQVFPSKNTTVQEVDHSSSLPRKSEAIKTFRSQKDELQLFEQFFNQFYDEIKNRHTEITEALGFMREHRETSNSADLIAQMYVKFLEEIELVLEEMRNLLGLNEFQ